MKKLILPFIFLLLSHIGFSQFTIEQVLSSPFPTNLVASQESETIAWVFNQEGKRNIWITDLNTNTSRSITNFQEDDGQEISNLIFHDNSKSILFIRGGAPNRSGEIPNPTSDADGAERGIWMQAIDGSEMLKLADGYAPQLSPDENTLAFLKGGKTWFYDMNEGTSKLAFKNRGGVSGLRWSPDGSLLAFESRRGDHAFIGIYNLAKHEITYLAPSVDRDGSAVWSPDGKKLAFLRVPNERSQLIFTPRRSALPWSIMMHDLEDGTTKELWKAQEGQGSAFKSISAANQLLWTSDNHIIFPYEGEGWTQLYAVPVAGGPAKWLTPGKFEVQYVSLGPDKKTIYYSSNQNDIDRQHIWRVNTDGAPTPLVQGDGIQWAPVATPSGAVFSLASTGTVPAHVVKIEDGKTLPIAKETMPTDYPSKDFVEPEQVIFSASDGMKIHGQLFKPKKMERGKKYPALLFFHGGSRRQMLLGFHHRGYYHNAFALNQYMANQGYIVLSVNYRSGIGYGMEFREALNYGANGASEFNDVMGAGVYLRSRSDVAPDKIGLWGGSYGGYLTALGLAKASDLFAAGVDIHGVHDWNVVVKNFISSYDAQTRAEFAKKAYASSPMPYVKDWRSPVLLIHGDDDRNVPFSETVDIAEALRRQGVYFEQLIFPDEVHGFLLHRNWLAAYRATADFFDRMLKE